MSHTKGKTQEERYERSDCGFALGRLWAALNTSWYGYFHSRTPPAMLGKRRNATFAMPFMYKLDHFTKTGSGQTWGKHPKRETCVYYIAGVWNWNAPMWLGVNTINVNGKTTTLIGSCLWYGKRVFSDAFYTKNDLFTKTDSGPT